jgi:hypothetical protein
MEFCRRRQSKMISGGLTRAKSNQKGIFIGKGGDTRDEG